jgi:Phosphate-induced protein 1 conserved region
MNLSTFRKMMLVAMLCACGVYAAAQATRASNYVPTGKGFGAESDAAPPIVQGNETNHGNGQPQGQNPGHGSGGSGNGINYHGGPVMTAPTVNAYYIWYGNWTNGPKASDSQGSVTLLNSLLDVGGLNNSGYEQINTTYYDGSNTHVSGSVVLAQSTTDAYSQGTALSDAGVQAVVSSAISGGKLPKDTNAIYFVLTSSDVNETSGFCTQYCGWHTHGTIAGSDIKYSFVGNPDRCPSACEAQTTSPNNNSGADGMASIIAHESEEAISDPDLNAWYDVRGNENADKCAWKFGPVSTAANGSAYNQTFANGSKWLLQMNWANANGGGCEQTLGGPFYTQ